MNKTEETVAAARTSRLLVFFCVWVAAAALALIWYDAVLLGRVMNDKARHIGGDVVVMGYIVASFCSVALVLLISPLGGAQLRWLRWLIAGLCLCAAAGWFVLHGGGYIFSHESMFGDPCCYLSG